MQQGLQCIEMGGQVQSNLELWEPTPRTVETMRVRPNVKSSTVWLARGWALWAAAVWELRFHRLELVAGRLTTKSLTPQAQENVLMLGLGGMDAC